MLNLANPSLAAAGGDQAVDLTAQGAVRTVRLEELVAGAGKPRRQVASGGLALLDQPLGVRGAEGGERLLAAVGAHPGARHALLEVAGPGVRLLLGFASTRDAVVVLLGVRGHGHALRVLDIGAGGLEVVLTLSTAARLRFGCGL